jgi:hypothetical protein
MTSQFKIDVTIPSNITSGSHLLIATQAEHNMNGGNPARALISVGSAAPAAAGSVSRPTTLLANSGRSATTLVLIGLAVAGVGLFLAGLLFLVTGRRHPEPEAVRA